MITTMAKDLLAAVLQQFAHKATSEVELVEFERVVAAAMNAKLPKPAGSPL